MDDFTIDRKNKSFVFDDGEVIPIPKDKEKQVLRSKAGQQSKREAVEKWQEFQQMNPIGETGHALVNSTSESLFGNLGDTLANYGVSGLKALKTGEGQEGMGYVDRVLDHFYAMQEGRKEYLGGLQEKHPTASTIGKGLGIAGELGTLYGVPGVLAFPAMEAGHSETSFLEPGEKAKELGKSAISGLILDKFFGGLSKVAGHREAQRELRGIISETEGANLAEIERAAAATQADRLRYGSETAAREAELGGVSKLQQAENEAFKGATNAAVDRVAKTMGKQSLSNEILGVEDFINQSIETSAHAITPEANYVSRFLRSVFKGDKNGKITGESLKKGVNALDEAIIKNEGTIKELLIEYKNSLAKTLPDRLASDYVFQKWSPKILKGAESLENDLGKLIRSSSDINQTLTQRLGTNYINDLNQGINKSIKETLGNFKNNFNSSDPLLMREEISNAIRSTPEYEKMMNRVNSLFPGISNAEVVIPEFGALKTSLEKYPEILAERISKGYEKYIPDIAVDFSTKGGVTQSALQKAPASPNILPPPPPVSPAMTVQPNLHAVPQMPEPQGVYGKLAQGLESMRNTGVKPLVGMAKNNMPAMALAKLSGFPIAKVAAGGAAIASGARALTSPSAAGKSFRNFISRGVGANKEAPANVVDMLAQKYPSYNNGIIESALERRSLTKEIENLSEFSLEQKAIFQSKINRGKPLQERL